MNVSFVFFLLWRIKIIYLFLITKQKAFDFIARINFINPQEIF